MAEFSLARSGLRPINAFHCSFVLIMILAFLLLAALAGATFIDKPIVSISHDISLSIDRANEYLLDIFTPIVTLQPYSGAMSTALHQYPRGLKHRLLLLLDSQRTRFGNAFEEADLPDALEKFANCTNPLLQVPFASKRTRKGHRQWEEAYGRLKECLKAAEVDIVMALRESADAESFNEEEVREGRRRRRLYDRVVKELRDIDLVERGEVIRWPWLTDEGWTPLWILGLVTIILIVLALIAAGGWALYTFVLKEHLQRRSDHWDE